MLRCHNCKQDLPKGSLFCNKCGSKIRSSTSKSHTDVITPIIVKNSDLIHSNEKDKFPVKVLILIILIVLSTGLYSVYDHYWDAQEPETTLEEYTSSLTEGTYVSSNSEIKTNNYRNTWNKTSGNTTGYDWLEMNSDQKRDIVDGVIMDWKSNSFEVSVSSSYFISALDAFYGDNSTNSNNLAEAMSMIGLSGNVLSKK